MGDQRTHNEVFVKLMDESDSFTPFQKYALLKFGIDNEEDDANTIFQAAFETA